MKLQHRRTRLTKPPQTRAWLLCLFFAAGILAGFLARRTVKSDDLLALGSYFSDYAALTVQQPADIISVVWAYLRYPAAAFLLGFTAWGVMLLPLLCTAQGGNAGAGGAGPAVSVRAAVSFGHGVGQLSVRLVPRGKAEAGA